MDQSLHHQLALADLENARFPLSERNAVLSRGNDALGNSFGFLYRGGRRIYDCIASVVERSFPQDFGALSRRLKRPAENRAGAADHHLVRHGQ